MCLCKRLHEGTLLKQTGNSRANVSLTLKRNNRDPSRHSYDTLFNRGTQARIPKYAATAGKIQSCLELNCFSSSQIAQAVKQKEIWKGTHHSVWTPYCQPPSSVLKQWHQRGCEDSPHIWAFCKDLWVWTKDTGRGREVGRDKRDMRGRERKREGEGEFSMD